MTSHCQSCCCLLDHSDPMCLCTRVSECWCGLLVCDGCAAYDHTRCDPEVREQIAADERRAAIESDREDEWSDAR
jgi:hypothetical protein